MADKYFLAPSLVTLRNEINAIGPNRDKTSDGWIGDSSHQARKSDHNPDYSAGGIVRAIDVDEDGINANSVIAKIIKDPRVAYVIYERRIWTKEKGWYAYTGVNPHDKHFHVSIKHTATAANSGTWGISSEDAKPSNSKPSNSKPATPAPAQGGSVVDYLNRLGKNSSWAARKELAAKYGIKNYSGTAAQNLQLLGFLKAGVGTKTPDTKKVTGSLVDYLNNKKKDSSFTARKKLAGKYGIRNYTGTAAQNTLLLKKLQG